MRLERAVLLSFVLMSVFISFGHAKPVERTAPAAQKQELSSAFKNLNSRMHRALGEAVQRERQSLGPLILFEEGEMRLYKGDNKMAGFPISPPLVYHKLKVLGHAAFATMIQMSQSNVLTDEKRNWLQSVHVDLKAAHKELKTTDLPASLRNSQNKLIELTSTFIKSAIETPPTEAEIKAYAAQIKPHLKAGFDYCARLHIDLIHAQAKKLYALLTPAEYETVRVYFYGGRGARVGNLALQYMSWFIGERTGKESERIIFSEGIYEHQKAMDALAKYSIERRLAEISLGDSNALHRDVLSDATRAYLETFPEPAQALQAP